MSHTNHLMELKRLLFNSALFQEVQEIKLNEYHKKVNAEMRANEALAGTKASRSYFAGAVKEAGG